MFKFLVPFVAAVCRYFMFSFMEISYNPDEDAGKVWRENDKQISNDKKKLCLQCVACLSHLWMESKAQFTFIHAVHSSAKDLIKDTTKINK